MAETNLGSHMEIKAGNRDIAEQSQDAIALHIKACPDDENHTIISARPRNALMSGTQLKNLSYLINREAVEGNKITVKDAQIKDYHFADLQDKFDCYSKDLNFAVSVIN